jgi:hypothetical protein
MQPPSIPIPTASGIPIAWTATLRSTWAPVTAGSSRHARTRPSRSPSPSTSMRSSSPSRSTGWRRDPSATSARRRGRRSGRRGAPAPHVAGGGQDRQPARGRATRRSRGRCSCPGRVHADGRPVDHQPLRAGQQADGDVGTALHAPRVRVDSLVGPSGQPVDLQHLVHPPLAGRPAQRWSRPKKQGCGAPVRSGYSAISCGTSPMAAFASTASRATPSRPTSTSPPSGRSDPQAVEMVVVPPAPFGPAGRRPRRGRSRRRRRRPPAGRRSASRAHGNRRTIV